MTFDSASSESVRKFQQQQPPCREAVRAACAGLVNSVLPTNDLPVTGHKNHDDACMPSGWRTADRIRLPSSCRKGTSLDRMDRE
jgi:hypothetical protein